MSDVGLKRPINQDSYLTITNKYGDFLGAVCDGIGGANAGDVASGELVKFLASEFVESNEFKDKQKAKEYLNDKLTLANKRIYDFDLDLLKVYLREGFVPVLFGDVVIDDEVKIAVISGDQILQYIAKFLKSDRIVLGTDVAGVYTKNPKTHDDAVHIDEVNSIDDIKFLESTTNVDVTGGMVGKVKELLDLADYGISSEIINANEEGAIAKALQGMKVNGTKICRR